MGHSKHGGGEDGDQLAARLRSCSHLDSSSMQAARIRRPAQPDAGKDLGGWKTRSVRKRLYAALESEGLG